MRQKATSEKLQCSANRSSNKSIVEAGYVIFASKLHSFSCRVHALNPRGLCLAKIFHPQLCWNKTLYTRWHHSFCLKYSQTELSRAKKRKGERDLLAADVIESECKKPNTRRRFTFDAVGLWDQVVSLWCRRCCFWDQ